MSDFPGVPQYAPPGPFFVQNLNTALGGLVVMSQSTFSGAAWFAANAAIFIPIIAAVRTTVTQMMWSNGATLSGNVDAGIYDFNGNRLTSTGSTVQAGVSVSQITDVTDTILPRGLYYMALACSNTTATFSRTAVNQEQLRVSGVQIMTSAFPLPATATFANPTAAYLPVCAAAIETVA
jgi:hypothetical protein